MELVWSSIFVTIMVGYLAIVGILLAFYLAVLVIGLLLSAINGLFENRQDAKLYGLSHAHDPHTRTRAHDAHTHTHDDAHT